MYTIIISCRPFNYFHLTHTYNTSTKSLHGLVPSENPSWLLGLLHLIHDERLNTDISHHTQESMRETEFKKMKGGHYPDKYCKRCGACYMFPYMPWVIMIWIFYTKDKARLDLPLNLLGIRTLFKRGYWMWFIFSWHSEHGICETCRVNKCQYDKTLSWMNHVFHTS